MIRKNIYGRSGKLHGKMGIVSYRSFYYERACLHIALLRDFFPDDGLFSVGAVFIRDVCLFRKYRRFAHYCPDSLRI